jgi:glycosyltransferase involved in cell wall biosynthesis
MVKQADCLVINLPQFEGCITALIARLLGKRVVCVYHCEISLRRGLKNKIIQKVLEGANQLSLLLCHKVVTYTHDYADHSRILKPFINKLKVIYPPVTKPVVDRLVKQRLDRVIGRRDITIGVAARLAEEKGMEYLFNSIPILKEELEGKKIMIAIAGATDPIGEGKYKKEITKLVGKYKDNIVFLGTLSQEEIGAFYSLLDVLVLPSINSTEAFGMVQVEAMLCGVPVVASSLPGVRVPIQKTGMGLIIPIRNSLKIAKAIIKILIERRKYIRPLTIIEKEFDLSDTITKFKKILVNDN